MAVLTGKLSEHPLGEYADKPFKDATSSPASSYLAEKIFEAIKSVVSLPEQAKVYVQKLAQILAAEGKPVRWTTPTGLPWANRYFEPNTKVVSLWLHDARVQLTVGDGRTKQIRAKKSSNAISPNLVHALDASHLAMVVNAAVAEGITSLATVHDSFGCLASRAGRFRKIIREQFVRMYEEHDVLAEITEAAKRDLNEHDWKLLPQEVEYGSLRLQDVIEAEYAFA
jgi:DNA-directed RNA polymerase